MKKLVFTNTVMVSVALMAFNSTAATSYMEARNDAMGGTGVVSSHYGTAALSNPALLTRFDTKDYFSLVLPSVGVQFSDPDKALDAADDIQNLWNKFGSALDSQSGIRQSAAIFRGKLNSLQDIRASGQLGVSVVATVPNYVLPYAIVVKSWGTVSLNGNVTAQDLKYLDQIADGIISPGAVDKSELTSRAHGRAAVITDVGVAMAREFETAGYIWSLGMTPKYQRVDLFNYNVSISEFDSHDFDEDKYRNTKTGFNADVGLATELNKHWSFGLTVQNVLSRSIETKVVNDEKETFKMKPQATIGTSWHNSVVTAAIDVDLTEASRFAQDEKRQFASLGGEVNVWNWMQVRAGYRHNIAADEGSAFTAGMGVSPFGVTHLDITGIAGADRTYGAMAQLQVTF